MKKIAIALLGCLTTTCFAQNSTSWLLSYIKTPVNVNACYQATPAIVMHTQADQVLFHSTDGGTTWIDLSKGLPAGIEVSNVLAKDGGIYLGTMDGKLYHNSDLRMDHWELQTIEGKTTDGFITGIFAGNSCTYASVYKEGFYRQVAGTNNWKSMNGDLKNKLVFSVLETTNGTIQVACETGIYQSKDDGKRWNHIYSDGWVNSIVNKSNVWLANGDKGILRSTDNGEHWNYVLKEVAANFNISVIDGYFVAIRMVGSMSDINPYFSYVTISTDEGITWKEMETGKPADNQVYDLKKMGKYLFSSRVAGISRSNDLGKSWQLLLTPPTEDKFAKFEMVVSNTSLFAFVRRGGC